MLYLVRHGQTDWNLEPTRCQGWIDVPLNDVGRGQARADGRRLASLDIQRIVSSQLVRARETAEIVRAELEAANAASGGLGAIGEASGRAAGTGGRAAGESAAKSGPGAGRLELVVDERLAETDRGRWQGRRYIDIVAEEPDAWHAYKERPESFRFPGGESFAEQQRRVLAALRDVAADGRTTLVVTHGGSIRLTRAFLEGRGITAFHEMKVPDGQTLNVPCAGLVERIDSFLATRDANTTDDGTAPVGGREAGRDASGAPGAGA